MGGIDLEDFSDQTEVITDPKLAVSQDPANSKIVTFTKHLTSRSFASKVIERLDLTKHSYFCPTLILTERTAFDNAMQILSSILFASLLPQTGLPDSDAAQLTAPALSQDEIFDRAVSKLISGLNARQKGFSSIIATRFISTNTAQTATIANTVAELFVEEQLQTRQPGSDDATQWLDRQVEKLHQKAIESERSIALFRIENKIISVGKNSLNDTEVAQLSDNLIVVEAQVAEKQSKLAIIRDSLKNGDSLASISEVKTSPAIAAIHQQEIILLSQEAQLREEFGPNHPRILEIKKIVAILTNELGIVKQHFLDLSTRLTAAKEALGTRNKAEVELAELEREEQANRDLYTLFLNRLKFLTEEQELIGSNVRVGSQAVPPNQPTFPQPSVIFVTGFVATVLSGGLIALIREGLEQGLPHARQVEQNLGLPTLGMVPELKKIGQKPHRYLHDIPLSSYAESSRRIHIALQYGWVSRRPQIILAASSLPNEGKTTLAMSLATSFAESETATLLIDLDFRNPSIAKQMESARPGTSIINYWNGSRNWEESLHNEPDIERLNIIRGSTGIPNPVHCLESHELKEFPTDMRNEYDQFILNAPPVLGISDTRVAARSANA